LLLHTSPLLRVVAVFGILRTKYWGIFCYLAATFLFLLFCTVPQFDPLIVSLHTGLFVGLVIDAGQVAVVRLTMPATAAWRHRLDARWHARRTNGKLLLA